MKIFKPAHHRINSVLAGLLLASLFLGLSARPASAQALPQWQDTGITYKTDEAWGYNCIDPLQPGKLLVSNPAIHSHSYSIDLSTGQKTQINSLPFFHCNEATGQLYAGESDFSKNGKIFSSADPVGVAVEHYPTHWASDGSLWVYSLQSSDTDTHVINLYASPDGGKNWRQVDTGKFQGLIQYMTVAASDGRVLYVLTEDVPGPGRRYTLYASNDAGVSWGKRFEQTYPSNDPIFTPTLYLMDQTTKSTPANYVEISEGVGAGSNGTNTTRLSTDGGKTFVDIGITGKSGSYLIYYSDNAVVRFFKGELSDELENSVDGGKTWKPLALPFQPVVTNPAEGPKDAFISQVPNAPSNLIFGYSDGEGYLFHSPDGGKTWHNIGSNRPNILFSPYAPSVLFSFTNDKIFKLDLTMIDKTQTRDVAYNNGSDTIYFAATHHNLSGIFKKYWEDHGGLAQFGMPWTEPFREVNAETGKIYMVQYFERNRFEYHPENAGTPYEVLLGLLGNNQTANRRTEGAFVRFDDAHYPGGAYFPQTGHNLRNSFKDYWETNGGLAIYGYPISEEFEEVNPDDGKTYVVQYFERNRFEYHPENKGTKYEVLLGLLGNTLLKSKGWL